MTDPAPPPGTPASTIVLCEKHGLRYNAATHDGCARCRKEAGQPLTGAMPVPAPAPSRAGVAPTPLGPPLAVALVLVVVASLGLFGLHTAVHRHIVATWGGLLGVGGEDPSPGESPSTQGFGGGDPYAVDDDSDDGE